GQTKLIRTSHGSDAVTICQTCILLDTLQYIFNDGSQHAHQRKRFTDFQKKIGAPATYPYCLNGKNP
ncbi:hypothetical protein CHS0354_005892, partial [Potamilus streckersoni]